MSLHPVGSHAAWQLAREHARMCYPEESCGFIVRDGESYAYAALQNRAADPAEHVEGGGCSCRLCHFVIDPMDFLQWQHLISVIVHSHPNGPLFPSMLDMSKQIESGFAWGIIALDADRTAEPLIWGGDTPIEPVIGREFMHGVRDCYSLVRDVFRLGRENLAAQGVNGWPFDPIDMHEVPREDDWWSKGANLYLTENGGKFAEIPLSMVRPGDGFLVAIRSDVPNHAGLLLEDGTIIHHLPGRLSRREPAGLWSRAAVKWMRYVGEPE